MNLRAIVIGVENTRGNPIVLPGARLDAQKVESFLLSASGGAWTSAEIRRRLDPTREQVVQDVAWAARADYALVHFSGHGCVRMEASPGVGHIPVTYMDCSDGKELSELDLAPAADRVLLILDCCRGVEQPLAKAIKLATEVAKALRTPISTQQARQRFETYVAASEKGKIIVHGCDLNESADDLVSFSRTLIGTTEEWSAESTGVLTVVDAFESASRRITARNSTQNPKINAGRRRVSFPFGVGRWL